MEQTSMEGDDMYTLSQTAMEKVRPLALQMGQSQEAEQIPEAEGQVLVRFGTQAYKERESREDIIKIPVELDVDGHEGRVRELFFVCSA